MPNAQTENVFWYPNVITNTFTGQLPAPTPIASPKVQRPTEKMDLDYGVSLEIGKAIPEVQAVFVHSEKAEIYVWTVIPEQDETVSRRVHKKERELLSLFPDLDFTFGVVPSNGRDPHSIISEEGAKLVYVRQ
jgi:hypothetical protein